MDDPTFTPGFRFSTLDAIVLVLGAAAAVAFALVDLWIGVAIAFVVLHFFLFCNILRMSRPLELLWATVFVVLAVLATAKAIIWPIAFGVSLLTTIIAAIAEMRRPSYHGVAWNRVNPQLPNWWQARTSGGQPSVAVDRERS